MADQGRINNTNPNILMREYRKGNWTVNETMVLIEAKRMDDERRMKRTSGDEQNRGKPTELRWKWVEDYCWRRGCLRSQNQCNDKWDNLMRDYKKVREYERRVAAYLAEGSSVDHMCSYWKMEKSERKEKGLPSSMLPQTYEALAEVVERKGLAVERSAAPGGIMLEPPQHVTSAAASPVVLQLPIPPPQPLAATVGLQTQPPLTAYVQPLPTPDSDTSEHSESPAKRRRGGGDNHGEGTSTGAGAAAASTSTSQEVGTAISKSASVIAEALQACEEREEQRHRDLVGLHERRLRIEESKTEINRQGITGLVDSINKLASSIFALASSHKHQSSTPK